jgi:endonuclease-3
MKKDLSKINKQLVDYFGIPKRKKRKPQPIDILLGTILSQNTNDKNSFNAYRNLKSKIQSYNEILNMKISELENVIKVAGLGKQKAVTIKSLLKKLMDSTGKISIRHLLKSDDDIIIEELTKYKGIGVKTASCVLLFALHRNTCPVDTHVHRVLNRVGIVKTNLPDKTYFKIKDHIPDNSGHSLHTNLLRLGREFCTPKNPKCLICPIKNICKYPCKNQVEFPKKPTNDFFLLDKI